MNKQVLLAFCLAAVLSINAQAGAIFFNDNTDTISLNQQTVLGNAVTVEAIFSLTGNGGILFNEHSFGTEDKQFFVSSSTIYGYTFPHPGPVLQANTPVAAGMWHHYAYVLDGLGQERLYLDGNLVASRSNSAMVGNDLGLGFLGAIFRSGSSGGFRDSFIGYLDSFRISSSVLYTSNFTAPIGDFTARSGDILLLNFNEGSGTTVSDPSGQVRGTLGTGFVGATAPEWVADPFPPPTGVPEPSSIALALTGLAAFAWQRQRR